MNKPTRARITPNIVRSQYSKVATLLDGFNLIIEGGRKLHFSDRATAAQYAKAKRITLAYS